MCTKALHSEWPMLLKPYCAPESIGSLNVSFSLDVYICCGNFRYNADIDDKMKCKCKLWTDLEFVLPGIVFSLGNDLKQQ